MNDLIPAYSFEGRNLRCTRIGGEPWFSASDACRCLGLDATKGTFKHLIKLDADERRRAPRSEYPELFSGVRGAEMTIVSWPGLFKLIQRSNKPEAKRFDRWVRHEVLPSIMDNGGYVMPDADIQEVVEDAP